MSLPTLGIDAYQLTTLIAHADAGRLGHQVCMSFFFRRMPQHRNFVVFAGLRQLMDHAAQISVEENELIALDKHPVIGKALRMRGALKTALQKMKGFVGDIDACAEGTLLYAGGAQSSAGKPIDIVGAPLHVYIPMMQVRTDMVRAKFIETPWLGYINYMSMVASKAARVVIAADGKPVLEFGSRRTHPQAALDAAYAAYLAGVDGSSNIAAYRKYGVPAVGTMDHFAVQASERLDKSPMDTETEFFTAFAKVFPEAAVLLVDTYETERGIRSAVTATQGRLTGIRLDSSVSVEAVQRARAMLVKMNAANAKIYCSDGLDEFRVRELQKYADGFGVGENITTSPDSATGVGAVSKITINGYGKVTMKLAKGSGKATLPGELQVYRFPKFDYVCLSHEIPPTAGKPLLLPVWRGAKPVGTLPTLEESRAFVRDQIMQLPATTKGLEPAEQPRTLVASDALVDEVRRLVEETRVS